jgi:tetratricopeptide (TPR) repeat protein
MLHHRSLLTLLCIVVLIFPACSRRRSVAVTPTPGSTQEARNSSSPAGLSEYIRAVLKISQENTVALEDALAQLHKRRPELAALARHVSQNSDDVDSRKMLAAAYMQEDFKVHALQLYQEVQVLSPKDPVSAIGIARIWDAWGDYQIARRHAERAVEVDPLSPQALEVLGRIHLHRFELDRALRAFMSALEFSPQNAPLLSNVGYTYMALGNLEQARGYLERAVEIDGTLSEARNNLGVVLAQLGDAEGALEEFMMVGDPAAAYNNLGVAYLAQKRWREARDAFRRALALNPDYAKAQTNLAEAELHLPPPTVIYLPEAPKQEVYTVDEKPVKSLALKDRRDASKPAAAKAKAAPARNPVRTTRFSAAYKDALNRFQAGQYSEAIGILRWLLDQRPDHPLASNCHYWIGECYFGLGEYSKAHAAFKRVSNYSRSPKSRDARVMMNRAYSKMKQQERPRTVRATTNRREVGKKISSKPVLRSKKI